ncbi:hypothetical protein [Novosphingobium decolorationis]|uniref:Glycosyl hydrolase family 79 n=1 Tax=Novosphingobium decolorationis TaxID=2698673 RepID=A0ABX8E0U8_9SPHN|nr:hypothetical protein [Novosphingobium decolorationis]QVM82755.1 hypothetical protein HT578_02690 [Novosphingobium decolorationis]
MTHVPSPPPRPARSRASTRLRRILLTTGLFAAFGGVPAVADAPEPALAVGKLAQIGTVDARFLSYNVEMVELTGGRFWKPYREGKADPSDQYEYRPPIDLSNPRLRTLAAALGPVYLRYSGTWANATTYRDEETHEGPAPEGFDAVLTRAQWRGAIDFAKAVDGRIVTSMPTSAGARDENGAWQSDAAERWLAATHEMGGKIWASEFANEPNLIGGTQPPKGYTSADYRRDYTRFHDWLAARSPQTRVLAPGAFEYNDGSPLPTFITTLPTREMVPDGPARPDVVSFHFYGEISQRCAGPQPDAQGAQWLGMIDHAIARTKTLRREIAPDAPLWLTETAETACGGNPQAATFADTFRFVDQLARAARQGVSVVMHNTLAASDYALLDEKSFAPRPNYWAALLWKRTMGTRVLDAGSADAKSGLRLYAQCQRGVAGGVSVLAINPDRTQPHDLALSGEAEVRSLTQAKSDPAHAALNGVALELGAGDTLPDLAGLRRSGSVTLAPSSVTFLTFAKADNPACR